MHSKNIIFAVMTAAVAACSTPQPEPPFVPNPVENERCYRIHEHQGHMVGRAKLATNDQFYFSYDCSANSYEVVSEAGQVDTESGDADPEWLEGDSPSGSDSENNSDAGEESEHGADSDIEGTQQDVSVDNAAQVDDNLRAEEDYECIKDKMSAGTPGLEPCPIDDE